MPFAWARSASICGVRGINGKNDVRPKIASSAGTSVRLAIPIIRIETLNGTANRWYAPYLASSNANSASTTVNPLIAIAPEEWVIARSKAWPLCSSTFSI
ncbi:hypothetical protein D3C87_1836610 [compost metagenome]